jgi:anti-anti-sigma factor
MIPGAIKGVLDREVAPDSRRHVAVCNADAHAWTEAAPFRVVGTASPRRVRVIGELDIATVNRFSLAVWPSLAAPGDFTLDLSELDFIDCPGMHAVAEIRKQMKGSGHLILSAPGTAVLRALTLAGLDLVPGIHIVPAGEWPPP